MLLDEAGRAYLTDFGIAHLRPDGAATRTSLLGVQSTAIYMDPSLYVAGSSVSTASDVYSFGILAWELLTGKTAFTAVSSSLPALISHVTAGGRPDVAELPADLPTMMPPLLSQCWSVLPSARPKAEEVLAVITAAAVELQQRNSPDELAKQLGAMLEKRYWPPETCLDTGKALQLVRQGANVKSIPGLFGDAWAYLHHKRYKLTDRQVEQATELCLALIDAGIDVNSCYGMDGDSLCPLTDVCHFADTASDVEIALHLLRAGANPNPPPSWNYHLCALTSATNMPSLVRALLAAGADPNVTAWRATQHSVSDGIEIVKMLLDAGADVNAGLYGKAPLLQACQFGHTEIALLLIKAGADIHVTDTSGKTPLMYTCERNEVMDPVIVELVERGADEEGTALLVSQYQRMVGALKKKLKEER